MTAVWFLLMGDPSLNRSGLDGQCRAVVVQGRYVLTARAVGPTSYSKPVPRCANWVHVNRDSEECADNDTALTRAGIVTNRYSGNGYDAHYGPALFDAKDVAGEPGYWMDTLGGVFVTYVASHR